MKGKVNGCEDGYGGVPVGGKLRLVGGGGIGLVGRFALKGW